MPACKNAAELGLKFICLASLVLQLGCGDRSGDFGFTFTDVESRVAGQLLNVELRQELSFSAEARNALENGVPLHLEVRAELDTSRNTVMVMRRFEIRYMPLSNHFQLSSDQPASVRTFPRLRHALAELSEIELKMPLQGVAAGDYQLRTRCFLEKRKLPAPMRLPAWFAPNWQHDSGWQSWPVSISNSTVVAGTLPSS
jgi:hypothetical protein